MKTTPNMKVFGFTNNAGWIGGSGIVIADDKETALAMINEQGKIEPMKFEIELDDITEIEPGKVYILTTGDY